MDKQQKAALNQANDPDYIEYTAYNLGIETDGKSTKQLMDEILDFEKQQKEMENFDIPFEDAPHKYKKGLKP